MQITGRVFQIILILVLAIAALLGLVYLFDDFLVDLWWFDALGYQDYFWLRQAYQYLVLVLVTLFFFAIFFFNFWIGAKHLGVSPPDSVPADPHDRQLRSQRLRHFQTRSLALYLPLSLALGVLIALPLYAHWETTLLYLAAPSTGVADPVFGNDISWYLFSLPLYTLVLREVLLAFGIVLLGLILLYELERRIVPGRKRQLRRGAKIHLSGIMLLLFLIAAGYFVLERNRLLSSDNHLPLFYGPGYVEMHIALPLIWASIALLAVLALLFVIFVNYRKGLAGLATVAVLLAIVTGARHWPALSGSVERYLVKPNELTLEAPYIAHNIQATLHAYGLADVETRHYPIKDIPWDTTTTRVQKSLQNIPIWDDRELRGVFDQLQLIRTYYDFDGIFTDRYTVDDVYQQVFLAVREIDFKELPADAKNWVNEWLRYTHGYGAVMTPAAQQAAGPIEWFLQSIPLSSKYDLSVADPGIYYGVGRYKPVIAPNDAHEVDYVTNDTVVESDYRGKGGVGIGDSLSKLVFALHFGEKNIFLTSATTSDSRILFRRNIQERVSTLTPFLSLDPSPYPVVTSGHIYWIQDAYTSSSRYPYSRPYDGTLRPDMAGRNYIRNSVKIVVDAYDGTVDYYIMDPDDPIVQAYANIYPGLFKQFKQMPKDLQRHIRYPKSLFDVQLEIYARYHQTNPQIFYDQEDLWVFPEISSGDAESTITPYYLTLNLFDPDRFEMSLFGPMNAKGRRNMRALAVAGCDGDNYGKIVTYDFPEGSLVYGPPQAEAIIQQEPEIAKQFTLWSQQGVEATRGRLVIIPIDHVITYVQGVFLKAQTAAGIPELTRLIVSQGELATMAPTLEQALEGLNGQIRALRGVRGSEQPVAASGPAPASRTHTASGIGGQAVTDRQPPP